MKHLSKVLHLFPLMILVTVFCFSQANVYAVSNQTDRVIQPIAAALGNPQIDESKQAVIRAKNHLALLLEVDLSEITLRDAIETTWSDTSLGWLEPGKFYAQVLTTGYAVFLNYGQNTYEYRIAGRIMLGPRLVTHDATFLPRAIFTNISVFIDNLPLSADVKPILINNRVLVPIRAIGEAFRANVSWNDSTKTAIIRRGDTKAVLKTNSTVAQVNDREISLDSSAVIWNGRLMVPIRFISQVFGRRVNWLPDLRRVEILSGR